MTGSKEAGGRAFYAPFALLCITVYAISAWVFGHGTKYDFYLDDYYFLIISKYVKNPLFFMGHDFLGDVYRPFAQIYWWFAYRLFGMEAGFYYLAQILLHGLSSLLLGLFAFNLQRSLATGKNDDVRAMIFGFAASLYFAFLPANSNAIMWLAVINDVFPNAVFLGALNMVLLDHLKPSVWKKASAAALILVACLWKENYVMAAPVITCLLLYLFAIRTGGGIKSALYRTMVDTAPYWLAAAAFWALRTLIIRQIAGGYANRPYELSAFVNFPAVFSNMLAAFVFAPAEQSGIWAEAVRHPLVAAIWLFIIVTGLVGTRKLLVSCFLVWALLGLLPVIHLLPTPMNNSRLWYFSATAWSLAIAYITAYSCRPARKSGGRLRWLKPAVSVAAAACFIFIIAENAAHSRDISQGKHEKYGAITKMSGAIARAARDSYLSDPSRKVWISSGYRQVNISLDVFCKLEYPDLVDRMFLINASDYSVVASRGDIIRYLEKGFEFSPMHFNNPEAYDGYITTGLLVKPDLEKARNLGYVGFIDYTAPTR